MYVKLHYLQPSGHSNFETSCLCLTCKQVQGYHDPIVTIIVTLGSW